MRGQHGTYSAVPRHRNRNRVIFASVAMQVLNAMQVAMGKAYATVVRLVRKNVIAYLDRQ